MTRVYQLEFLANDYQSLYLEDESNLKIKFDGSRKLEGWQALDVYVLHPRLKAPDLWSFECSGAFAVSERAEPLLATFLEMAGELLPLKFGKRTLNLMNITEVINCVDYEHCDCLKDKNGQTLRYEKPEGTFSIVNNNYTFFANRFSESTIFKVPYDSPDIFVVERNGDPEEEFKAAVEHHGLKGVQFVPRWDSELGPIEDRCQSGVRTLYYRKNGERLVFESNIQYL